MKPITEKSQKQIEEEIADINRMKDMTLQLIEKAKELYMCSNKNEKKRKRRELTDQIDTIKQYLKEF